MSALIMLTQHCITSSRQCHKARKKKKKIYIGKEEIKPTLFTEDIIISVENPMKSTPPKKSTRINKFIKGTRYKINIQKSFVFPGTNNNQKF